jgi:hypothetical protein
MQSKLHFIKTLIAISLLCAQSLVAQTYSYLGTFNANGSPNYLVTPDVIASDLAQRIRLSLPEYYPVPTYHPEYLTDNVITDIAVTQLSDVWITFIDEGAGYQNTLAFYTYNLSQPPTTKPNNLTVVFPNMSLENNILRKGSKVLLGRFPANTGIGFVLIANGFQNGQVTNGYAQYYSNPVFNPEKNKKHKKHSVLLRDVSGKAVIGFEDLDRSSSGCDNDFNDAIFYATASPIALCTTCPPTVGTGNGGTSSGNNGGLESDGCLANAIAGRNFQRAKTPSVSYDNSDNMQAFTAPEGNLAVRNDVELEQYIPETPFYEPGINAFISSPKDLLGITNAQKVLAVDYFDGVTNERRAAVLTTKTADKVYDHTKVICDRLTGSTLLGAETILIDSMPFVRYTLQREDGNFEYAINFSIHKTSATTANVISRWSTEEYPSADGYWNYQVWADAPHMSQRVTEVILEKFKAEHTLTSLGNAVVPQVFVKKGAYDNGILTLTVHNPLNAKSLTINGNAANSETGGRSDITKQVALSGALDETVEVYVGSIFDMGFTVRNDKSMDFDALYFADGAWGLEYDKNKTTVEKYQVQAGVPTTGNNIFTVERNPIVKAQTTDYISLFRSLRPAGKAANMSAYTNLSFKGAGAGVAEIVLMKEGVKDWTKQYRAEVSLFDENQQYNLPLSIFSNGTGEALKANDITHVVFTLNNKTKQAKTFEISLENVVFNNNNNRTTTFSSETLTAYPNPATAQTTVAFTMPARGFAYVTLSNMQGQTFIESNKEFAKGANMMPLDLAGLPSGVYVATVMTGKSKLMTKILIP